MENLLGSHPKVKDVAVIGVPDDTWGEAVRAVVVLHDGQGTTDAELIEWCRSKIAGYKRPKSVAFIRDEEMPRTATGKILHRVLRKRYAADVATSALPQTSDEPGRALLEPTSR